jgi:hypothetical protein
MEQKHDIVDNFQNVYTCSSCGKPTNGCGNPTKHKRANHCTKCCTIKCHLVSGDVDMLGQSVGLNKEFSFKITTTNQSTLDDLMKNVLIKKKDLMALEMRIHELTEERDAEREKNKQLTKLFEETTEGKREKQMKEDEELAKKIMRLEMDRVTKRRQSVHSQQQTPRKLQNGSQ